MVFKRRIQALLQGSLDKMGIVATIEGMAVKPYIPAAYRKAIASDEPVLSLREAVADELEKRDDRQALLADLKEWALSLRAEGREEEEDAVAEVMNFLVGWCSPHMRIA